MSAKVYEIDSEEAQKIMWLTLSHSFERLSWRGEVKPKHRNINQEEYTEKSWGKRTVHWLHVEMQSAYSPGIWEINCVGSKTIWKISLILKNASTKFRTQLMSGQILDQINIPGTMISK
jgi:hypothetical protein